MLNSNDRGKHSELLAQTALLNNGYKVMEPINPQPYDLAIRDEHGSTYYVQVKTAYSRDEKRYNGEWIIVRGAKNNGKIYSKKHVDYFITVWENKVYMFENRELKEYWFRRDQLDTKAIQLPTTIDT